MRVDLIRPGELGPSEIAAWQSMREATPSLANPFLSAEFAIAVGQFRPSAEVAVLLDGQSIAGFFPFERRRLGLGVPVGGWLSGCQGVVHAPGVNWDPRELLRGCQLSAWQFDNLVGGQTPFTPYYATTELSPAIDLVDGFDGYYSKLRVRAPRFCRELGRKTRKLARDVGELRIVADSNDSDALRRLIAWKSEQYRRTSHVDRFSQAWLGELLEALLAVRGQELSSVLSALYAGDRQVAAQFGLRTGKLLAGWFTAYDIRFAKYSPGIIHLMQMTEQLATTGVQTISMGKGSRGYTQAVRNYGVCVAAGIATDTSILGRLHGARGATAQSALGVVRRHPLLHRAVDRVLRQSGISRHTYGRI